MLQVVIPAAVGAVLLISGQTWPGVALLGLAALAAFTFYLW